MSFLSGNGYIATEFVLAQADGHGAVGGVEEADFEAALFQEREIGEGRLGVVEEVFRIILLRRAPRWRWGDRRAGSAAGARADSPAGGAWQSDAEADPAETARQNVDAGCNRATGMLSRSSSMGRGLRRRRMRSAGCFLLLARQRQSAL
jgi:hypothetical protein